MPETPPAASRLRGLLANLALALAAVALTLGALEVALRVARARRGGGKEERTTALYTEHDPLLGWRKTPGARATFNRREYRVEAVINSKGLRDEEHAYAPEPGRFRFLSLGDSFVEGYGVEARDTATEVLERTLGASGCGAEGINGGTIGYSTDQEYLFFRSEGVKYAPRLVLLFFYYNDVRFNQADWYFGLPKPRLVEKDGRLALKTDPLPLGSFKKNKRQRVKRGDEPEPPRGSALVEWLADRLEHGAPRLYNALSALGLWKPIRTLPPKPEMQVFWRDAPPYFDRAWKTTDAILRGLATETGQAGARLLVVYVPSRFEVSDRDWELTRLRYGFDGRWDRALVRDTLVRLGRDAGIPVLDLTDALRRAERGALGGPYYVYDGHWNVEGHAIAAREIAAYLARQGWLASCGGR